MGNSQKPQQPALLMDCMAVDKFVELVVFSHCIPKDVILEITYTPSYSPEQVTSSGIQPNAWASFKFGPHDYCDITIKVGREVFKFEGFSKQNISNIRHKNPANSIQIIPAFTFWQKDLRLTALKPALTKEKEFTYSDATLDDIEHIGLVVSRDQQRLFSELKSCMRNNQTREWEYMFSIKKPSDEDCVGMIVSARSVSGKMREICHWRLVDLQPV